MSVIFVHDCDYALISSDGIKIYTNCEALQICTKLQLNCEGDRIIHVDNVKGEDLKRVIKEWCEQGHIDCGATSIKEWMLLLCASEFLGVHGLWKLSWNNLRLATDGMSAEEKLIAFGLAFKIVSSDGIILHLSQEAAKFFWSKDSGYEYGNDEPIFVDIAAMELQVILEWAEHHKLEEPISNTQWDKDLLQTLDARSLMKVLCAAYSLKIVPLQVVGMRVMNEKTKGFSDQETSVVYGLSYKLQSSDGQVHYLSEVASKQASNFCTQGHKLDTEEPIQMEMRSSVLALIIEWCEQHRTSAALTKWDQKFVEFMKWEDLQEVCMYSWKLGIDGLYNITMSVILDLHKKGQLDEELEIKMEMD